MLRRFPYPFASAVSVLSDVDGSVKERYRAYIAQLVQQFGLDFGDSTWLTGWPALGILSRDFTVHGWEVGGSARSRTFAESIAEYHLGNIDHFHAFLASGPRVAIL